VLQAVGESCKQINLMVQRAQTDDLYGAALGPDGLPLDENVQGEVQQKLDVVCNTIMLRTFCGCSNSIARVASEEEDVPRCCSDVMVRIYMLLHVHLQQKKRKEKGIIFSINSTLTFLFLLRLV
jgi:fructose-1,6-bisphosphatase